MINIDFYQLGALLFEQCQAHLIHWNVYDIFGAALSLYTVYLFTQANIYAWPMSIFANITNGYLYYQTGIFGHMGLEFIYVAVNIYGWIRWSKDSNLRMIDYAQFEEWAFHIGMLLVVVPILYFFLRDQLHSDIPFLDSLTTVMNLNAAWLMTQGRVESWIVWFVVDAIYCAIYWIKGLPFHLIQMLIYLVMAVYGYRRWFKILEERAEIEVEEVVLEVS